MTLVVWCECYANKCFAEKLLETWRGSGRKLEGASMLHRPDMGRDKILKKVLNAVEKKLRNHAKHILMIDYEKGIARVYIDKQFNLHEVIKGGSSRIYIGTHKRYKNIVAIVFDPEIESFLFEQISRELERYYKKLKTREACNILAKALHSEKAKEILRRILEEVAGLDC